MSWVCYGSSRMLIITRIIVVTSYQYLSRPWLAYGLQLSLLSFQCKCGLLQRSQEEKDSQGNQLKCLLASLDPQQQLLL
jgi:hypothetical protein